MTQVVEINSTYSRVGSAHLYTGKTMTDMHEELCSSLAYGHSKDMDMINSVDVQKHNVIATADSMEWDFDLQDLWLTRSRWTTMIRQYINPIAFEAWVNTAGQKLKGRKRGVSVMRTNEVQRRESPTRNGETTRTWRTWGSCMLAIGYRAMPSPQITLHSRTSYLGYIGALDLSVAYLCAKAIAEQVGLKTKDIRFVWHLEAAQFHGFKSLAYLLADDDAREHFMSFSVGEDDLADRQFKKEQPGLFISRKWMKSFENDDAEGKTYGDMNFGQTRRIRKRWHTQVMGYDYGEPFVGGDHRSASQNNRFKLLPSAHVDTLTFDNLFSSAARRSTRVNWDEDNVLKVDTTNERNDDELAE